MLLADDHPVHRDGPRMMLASTGQAEVVGTTADGEEAVAKAIPFRPQVADRAQAIVQARDAGLGQ